MADISCERCEELLGDYVEGILVAEVRSALEGHVGSCSKCARLVRDYRAIPAIVRRVTDKKMPNDVEARLRRLLAIARR
jgi:anti-sigma factor RsiW